MIDRIGFRSRRDRTRIATGFTLVELLVVIGIIAVLMGILLPSLGRARAQARGLREMAACRELLTAYTLYSQDHQGALLPGHLNDTPQWHDDQGQLLSPPEVAKRWPWRLVMYIRLPLFGTLLVNDQEDYLANRGMPMWSYFVSLAPSFGLNFHNLGGDLAAPATDATGVARKSNQVRRPSQMIVFASSRFIAESGYTQGFHRIVPPTKVAEAPASVGWISADYNDTEHPVAWGYLSQRNNGRVVAGFFDSHVEMLSVNELRDMTLWSNPAAASNNSKWKD